jgi:hypothetical protein
MTEIENSEVPEVAPQIEQVNVEADAKKAKEEADARNFKAMRLKNEDLERRLKERDETFEKLIQAGMQQAAQKPQEVDEFDSIGDEEFIPKGKVKALAQKEARKYAEQIAKTEIEKFHKTQQENQFLDRLQRQYSDFSEVVTPETLSLLEEKEPELAKTIVESKDPYKIGMQSYKYIKALGLVEKAPEERRKKEIDKAVEQSNNAIPSPMGFDKRPIAEAFKMTDAMKKDLYREMHGYAAMASSVPEMG